MKIINGVLLFTAGTVVGFTFCGISVVKKILNTKDIREATIKIISKRIENVIYAPKKVSSKKESYSYKKPRNYVYYTFFSEEEAQEVLYDLYAIKESYGVVTVADLNELLEVIDSETDEEMGWRDLSGACVFPILEGQHKQYLMKLPRPESIKEGNNNENR